MADKIIVPRACRICGKAFIPRTTKGVFCSPECVREGTRLRKAEWKQCHRDEIRAARAKKKALSKQTAPVSRKEMWKIIIDGMKETGLSYGEFVARLDGYK